MPCFSAHASKMRSRARSSGVPRGRSGDVRGGDGGEGGDAGGGHGGVGDEKTRVRGGGEGAERPEDDDAARHGRDLLRGRRRRHENRRTTKWVSGPTRSEVWTRRRWSGCARCGIRVAMVARDSELEPARVEKQRRGLGRLRKAMTCVSQREKRQDSKPKASDSRKAPRGGTATRARLDRARSGRMETVRACIPRNSRTVSSRGRCVAPRETRWWRLPFGASRVGKWRQSQNAALPLVDTARLEVATHHPSISDITERIGTVCAALQFGADSPPGIEHLRKHAARKRDTRDAARARDENRGGGAVRRRRASLSRGGVSDRNPTSVHCGRLGRRQV